MSHTNLSQQQTGSSKQPSQEIQEEDKTKPVPTLSSKKLGSCGKRVKTIAKKRLYDSYQKHVDRKVDSYESGCCKFNSLVNEMKAMSGENDENLMTRIEILYRAYEKSNFKHKSAWNFLKGKHKGNNPESTHARRNCNRVTNEELELFGDDALPRSPGMHKIVKSQRSSNSTAMSGENDENLMTRIEILYRAYEKSNFKHKSAWNFLKGKHKGNNPESTHARRNCNRVTNEELELFGDDALPRSPGMHKIVKSQRSSNSTVSSESNPAMFQEMMQQQLEIERKEKMERIDRE
nr:hypothetical protein [Tanacetum cinerariifolium]